MIKLFAKMIITILLFVFCIYVEDYVQRGMGIFLGMALFGIGLIFDRLEHFFGVMGGIFYFLFLMGSAIEVHIEKTQDGILVKSPFYTHVLEHGDSMDTKQLKCYYTRFYNTYEVKNDKFYFIYNGDTCTIFNKIGRVLKIPMSYTIRQKDFGSGILDYIVVNGKSYDLRGTEIKNGYMPYVSDRTPDYTSSPLN